MEPAVLRYDILLLLDKHEATGSSAYLDDKAMAAELGVPLAEVQRQLQILEHRALVTLAVTMGPSYAALLTPAGMEALEAAGSQQPPTVRRIGF